VDFSGGLPLARKLVFISPGHFRRRGSPFLIYQAVSARAECRLYFPKPLPPARRVVFISPARFRFGGRAGAIVSRVGGGGGTTFFHFFESF
jgi:hypothetical protein